MKKDYLKMLVQLLHTRHFWILYPFMQKRIKQEDNEVLFLSDSREEFSGNFAFVKEEIEKRKKFHITGIFKKNFKSKKGKSLNQSLEIIKAMCKAKYIFVDDFYPYIQLNLKVINKLYSCGTLWEHIRLLDMLV